MEKRAQTGVEQDAEMELLRAAFTAAAEHQGFIEALKAVAGEVARAEQGSDPDESNRLRSVEQILLGVARLFEND